MFHLSWSLRVKHFFLTHRWIEGLSIFLISAFACAMWISGPVFSDPDSFYHMKMTQLMLERHTAIVDFPWAAFTTLKNAYVDHHLLYHAILMPFVWAFGSVTGIKVATAVLFGICLTLFYGLLRSLRVRYAGIFTLLLLGTDDFAFRLSLAKAPSIGFLFLIGGYALLVHKQHRLLALLSFFFVWAYGGFMLLPIVVGMYVAFEVITALVRTGKWPGIRGLIRMGVPLWATLAGTLGGLLLHPSFPKHFQFYWQQVVQIGLVNYKDIIGVGGEWYPLSLQDLLSTPILLTSLLIASVIVVTIKRRVRYSNGTLTAVMMAGVFFLFTLKSQRYIEYYIPWGFLAAALVLNESGALLAAGELVRKLWRRVPQQLFPKTVAICMVMYVCIFIPGIVVTSIIQTNDSLHQGVPINRFAGAMEWLRQHSTQGDILFHNDWDDFPMLFNGVTRLRYIVGLDATFMYNYNHDLYWEWVHITTGEKKDGLFEAIQNDFNARFVLVDADHTGLYNNIVNDGRFEIVYHDDETTIFRIPRSTTSQPEGTTVSDQGQTSDPVSTQ
jgi:hypothetical protein